MLHIGARASIERAFGRAEIGPADEVPLPLLGAMISCLLGMHLPGPGTNYLKQDLRVLRPAPPGVPIIAEVEVTRLRPASCLVDLAVSCRLGDGTLLCEGRALVAARDVAGAFG